MIKEDFFCTNKRGT